MQIAVNIYHDQYKTEFCLIFYTGMKFKQFVLAFCLLSATSLPQWLCQVVYGKQLLEFKVIMHSFDLCHHFVWYYLYYAPINSDAWAQWSC